ncbi:deoxyribose-phosphate aldolase [Fibrella aquatilis]|uniref:Deoxyribose-phosphate aldolase n=1 Tax=Fibrella aquatilis TaxID=2817059 RepID=A0A939G209_9BACT|nr:deoxyribose-phosphate aldolase [Fibrella aquatilis]MBO0929645.1 deoxyribose-phosphate aldolase [Fibrella aquatilis]
MPNTTLIREIAKMIDHSLLHPTMTDAELRDGCAVALKYDVASVCIKPYAVPMAAELLAGSDVLVGTVIGFPAGNSTTAIKVAETIQACRDGAVEIDMVVNIGKVLSEDWDYVRDEIRVIHDACLAHGAILKVIFENDYLPDNKYIIKLCQLCTEVGAEFVKTSTGYGFVKGADGKYNYEGATIPQLQVMLDNVGTGPGAVQVQVKAAGGIRTLDGLLQVKAMGVTRLGASATAVIMEDAYRRFGAVAHDVPMTDIQEGKGY